MEGGEEDPFGSLVKLCRPTSSQELKLQTCPFVREFETFPDAFDSLGSSFSPAPTQSPPQGIVMVSLPDSEEDSPIDANAPLENEEFQTPPEEHHFSSSSSQEDPQRNLRPLPAVDEKVHMKRVTVDDERREDEAGLENLGFSEPVEVAGGENRVFGADCLERDGDIAVGLKEFEVSEGEYGEPALKKLRVSGENSDSVMHTRYVEGAEITEKVDDEDDSDSEASDEKIGLNEDKILIDVDSAEEFEDNDDDEVRDNGGKGIPDCKKYRESEVEKFKDGGSHGEVSNQREEEEEEGIHLDNGEKSVLRNAVEELEEGLRDNVSCKKVLSSMNREDIDAFKYNGGGSGADSGDHCWKEIWRRKRELPPSMREKGNDRGGKRDIGNLDVKNLSWKELMDALAVLLKNVDRGSEDVDFLETAKRGGMTFPLPRWI